MFICPLIFTKNDRIRLIELYEQFVKQLENISRLQPGLFISLKQELKEMLHRQKGMQDLWKQVQQDPNGEFHLHITHKDKAILNLPWQIAVDNSAVHITKGLPVAGSFNRYTPQAGPLRILVMIASPEDLDYSKRLSYEEEEQVILKMLAPLWQSGQVQVEFTEDGSLRSLQSQLQLQHYHILYFSGHGLYKDNTGYLYLENEETLAGELVSARQLGEVINAKPKHTPPLIILAACQTAQGNMKDGFRGIADELMYMGVPAVIAMAVSILDNYATLFAGHLYQHLANRHSLGQAYAKAISAMHQEEQGELTVEGQQHYAPAQWLIPQLYCSQQVEQVVDWQAPGRVLKVAPTGFIGGEEYLLLSPGKEYRFIGRRRENASLFSKLIHDQPVLIKGQGGVGKTALAEHLAKRLISQDPYRYCFAFNETNTSISEIAARLRSYLEKEGKLAEIENLLKKDEDALQQLKILVQQVSRCCKPLWIFDNIESFQEDIGGPLKDEHKGWMQFVQKQILHQFPVIFTGRYPVTELGNIADISLNQVSFVDYYRKCLQLNIGTNTEDYDQSGLHEMASLLYSVLGGSYRMLEFFDELYRNDRAHVQELLKQMKLLPAIKERQEKEGKRMVLGALLGVLNEAELATFHLLLYFKIPVLQQALEMQTPGKKVEAHLQRLKDLTLIEEHKQKGKKSNGIAYKFYYTTQLVRGWLQDFSLPRVEFYPEHAGDYFEYVFEEVAPTYGNKEEAFRYYLQSHNNDKINTVAAQIVNEYYRVGLYDLVLSFGYRAEAKTGVEIHEEILNNLGLTNLKFGRYNIALTYLTKFLIAARRMGDKQKEIIALNSISQVYYHQQDFDTALVWLEKSRAAARENQLQESEALTLTNIGNIYADREQFENALQVWRQSLQIRKATGNREGQIRVMLNISGVYTHLDEYKKAQQTLQKGLTIAGEAGLKQLESRLLSTIGGTYMKMGTFEEALPYLEKALEISDAIDDQEGMGEVMALLGTVHEVLENYDEAIEFLVAASTIMQRFGKTDLYLTLMVRIGKIQMARGEFAAAITILSSCLPETRQLGDAELEAQMLFDIGESYFRTGDFDEALKYLQESRSIYQSLGDMEGESNVLVRLSQVYSTKHDYDKALEIQEQRLKIQEELDDVAGQALTWYNMANCYAAKGDMSRYLKYATNAYTMNEEIEHEEGLFFVGGQLGIYLASGGDLKEIKKGLSMLKRTCEIGKENEFPDVEYLTGRLKQLTERYNEIIKKGSTETETKGTKADKGTKKSKATKPTKAAAKKNKETKATKGTKGKKK